MDLFLAFVEGSALSNAIRGSASLLAFPAIITLHTIAMGFLAGGSAAIDLRVLGFAEGIELRAMARYMPLLWLSAALSAVSGVLLLIAYPTKALTNPVFYVKLGLLALALVLLGRVGRAVAAGGEHGGGRPLRALALASLAAWVALITAGRLLAYTHTYELLGVPALT